MCSEALNPLNYVDPFGTVTGGGGFIDLSEDSPDRPDETLLTPLDQGAPAKTATTLYRPGEAGLDDRTLTNAQMWRSILENLRIPSPAQINPTAGPGRGSQQ